MTMTTSFAQMTTSRRRLTPGTRHLPVVATAVLSFAVMSAVAIQLSDQASWVIFTPLIVIGLIVGLWIVARAVSGSTSAIITYLVLIVFISDAQFRARGAGEIGTDWQSLLKFGLWLGAGIIGLANAPPLRSWIGRFGPACWLAYAVMAMISSAYAPAPVYSFGCGFALLCLLPFSLVLITKLSESQFLWILTITLAVFLIVGWGVYYENPRLGTSEFWTYRGIELRMCGLAGQANNLGSICAKYLGAIFLLWYTGRCRPRLAVPLAALGIVTLNFSDARTGMIAVVGAIVAVLLARSMKTLIGATLAAIAGAVTIMVFSLRLDALGGHFSRSGDPTEVFTLTGRLEIWEFVWQKITEHPLFGWGYSASKVLLPEYTGFQDNLMVDTAHNMLLQSLLSVGFVGTLPILAVTLYLSFSLVFRPYPFRDMFFVIVIISAISDTSALGTTPTMLTLLFIMASVLPKAPARGRSAAPTKVFSMEAMSKGASISGNTAG
jgi:exopolysaccharide production protein ExoQ